MHANPLHELLDTGTVAPQVTTSAIQLHTSTARPPRSPSLRRKTDGTYSPGGGGGEIVVPTTVTADGDRDSEAAHWADAAVNSNGHIDPPAFAAGGTTLLWAYLHESIHSVGKQSHPTEGQGPYATSTSISCTATFRRGQVHA
jgi:hypothetical protein